MGSAKIRRTRASTAISIYELRITKGRDQETAKEEETIVVVEVVNETHLGT